MNLNYSIQEFGDEYTSAYKSLLPHQTESIERGLLNWKFVNNPAGKGLVAVCRSNDNKILGMNAFQPGVFQANDGEKFIAYQSMDTIVSPEARGQGVFGKLLETFYESGNGDLIYGFPNSQSSKGFFGRLGWTKLGSTPYLIRPLRSGYFGKRLIKSFPDFKLPSLSAKPVDGHTISRFDDQVEEAVAKSIPADALCLSRNPDYLNWRIFDNPINDYIVLSAENQAYVIGKVADKHGGKIAYILDAFGEEKLLPGLIAAMVDNFSNQNADAVLGWCLPHSQNIKAFKKSGFFNLPEKLRPIEINFGTRDLSGKIDNLVRAKKWYISYLDSDTV